MCRIHFLLIAFVSFSVQVQAVEQFSFHHENVLGTKMTLSLRCRSLEEASKAESEALREIDRLAFIFSSYDENSELSRWLASGKELAVSQELRDVLDASERWHLLSRGAFQPGVERLTRIWKRGEQTQQEPSEAELLQAVRQLSRVGWEWNSDRTQVKSTVGTELSFNAIAKGYIIDAVCDKLSGNVSIAGGHLAIGGDMRAFGSDRPTVKIQLPVDDLAASSITEVLLDNHAIATSSGAFRGGTIAEKRYSHLLDPRTGYPVAQSKSVTAIAPTASIADALSTACSVLSPTDAIALVDSIPGSACLILVSPQRYLVSDRWDLFEKQSSRLVSNSSLDQDWNGGMELKIDFSIHQPEKGGRYRRPYLAVWVEDKDGNSIRTLVLWIHNTGHGQRWLPELKRWHRSDNHRKSTDETDLVKTVSEATRKPGAYSVTWNGQDDHQKLVAPGEYTLYIESAREHGSYQLIRKKLSIADLPFLEKVEGNAEIKSVSIEYRKKPLIQNELK